MLLRSAWIVFGLGLAGCATSTQVQLADGSTAHDVSCYGGRFACSDEARRVCGNRPYVVLDEDDVLGVMSKSQQGSIRVQCTDDYLAAQLPAPSPAPAKPKEGAACNAAYREIASLSAAWGRVRNGAPKAVATPQEAFMKTCATLPGKAQMCLVTVYRQAHHECSKVLGALDEAARERLDEVLLEPSDDDDGSVPLVGPGGTLNL